MAEIPFFRIGADGTLSAAALERPADKWAKAMQIMREGLRFEVGLTQYGVELMIVDRHGALPRQIAAEACANNLTAIGTACDRLIDKFHARLMPANQLFLKT